jgi:Uma2 family endonuclease
VFVAPLDFQPTRRRSLQPDLLVIHRRDVGEAAIERPLLLAVEVLSPSTRSKDLILKRGLYEDSGVSTYWVVDLDGPSITSWTLREGHFTDQVVAVGDDPFEATAPFAVRVIPSSLVEPNG